MEQACGEINDGEQLVARSKAIGFIQKIPTHSADVPRAFRDKAAAL
jgi:hypothetical protein